MSGQHISLKEILPHSYPFLLIDRVVEFDAGKRVVCLKNISCNEDMFQGCPPDNALFPSVYIVEAMAQTSGLLLDNRRSGGAFLSMMKDVLFHKAVRPGDCLMITSSLFHALSPLFMFQVTVRVEDELVAEAEITLALME